MPVLRSTDVTVHHVHGARFAALVSPSQGSEQLCAWRLDVPADLAGAPHRPTREEVLLVLTGALTVILDEVTEKLSPGDVVLVPAGSRLQVDGGPDGATAWVTTTPGLEAEMDDGTRLAPPWAR